MKKTPKNSLAQFKSMEQHQSIKRMSAIHSLPVLAFPGMDNNLETQHHRSFGQDSSILWIQICIL